MIGNLKHSNSFLNLLYFVKPHLGEVDSIVWTPSSHHGLAVKTYNNMLQSGENRSFPWKSIWKVKAPRIAFFLWATALGRILTVDNLKRQGFHIVFFYKSNIIKKRKAQQNIKEVYKRSI
jgi:hypothetical protein